MNKRSVVDMYFDIQLKYEHILRTYEHIYSLIGQLKKNSLFFNRCRRLTVVHKYEIRATVYAESIAVESEKKMFEKVLG